MTLTEREQEMALLEAHADRARTGRGTVAMVCGESGAGKTSFIEAFLAGWVTDERVLWGSCDPLSTPRPLGPLHDVAESFTTAARDALRHAEQPHDIFVAVYEELRAQPTVLVLDDLHWADQATIELLRFVLRRVARTRSLVLATVRDEEVGPTSPARMLLGDVARSADGATVALPPLSRTGVTELVGDRPVDAAWLHRVTGGNAFYVCEMLDHDGDSLPPTVRDAILARTAELDVPAWDLLNLLTCAPGAIPDHLLAGLGVTLPALRSLDQANLIRRSQRGVAFRHDLCRLAVGSVIPPGAEANLHRRLLDAHDGASDDDPAVITHHALGAGDRVRAQTAAVAAGRAAVRSGAHTQAAEFFATALECGGTSLEPLEEAELLEAMAGEYYLVDQLGKAIAAARRAMQLRNALGEPSAVSADHHALAVYEWYNANRSAADGHAAQAVAVLDQLADEPSGASGTALVQLGHAHAMQTFLALQSSEVDRAATHLAHARDIACRAADATLTARVGLVGGLYDVLSGRDSGRQAILDILAAGPANIDEVYSSGYSNLTYLDVEQRRLDVAGRLLDASIPLMAEHDLPVCRVWQVGSRARLALLRGEWERAATDAESVLDNPSAPLARTWPLLIRALVSLRRDGVGTAAIDEAWVLAHRYGEPLRTLPAAAAVVEAAWLTGSHNERLDECRALLHTVPAIGLDWARGELAVWLRRLGSSPNIEVAEVADVAEPYRLLLDGECAAAAATFDALGVPYDAALARIDSGDPDAIRNGLDALDRLGAVAVAAKVRRDLRSKGVNRVPARRRTATLANPHGLTPRQVEVLQLLDGGLTNNELADRLFLSVKTVDHHVSAILSKLQVTKRRDAVARARELGIVD